MENRRLSGAFTGNLDLKYSRTDVLDGNPAGQRSDVLYNTLRRTYSNGRGGRGKLDLLYVKRYNLINDVLTINLNNSLTNVWGDVLDFESVKLIVIQNIETTAGRFLSARFKDERYYIGPEGYRIISEVNGVGIAAIMSSSSSEEGPLIFSTDTDITFDLIIAGSSQESSSSSGA